MQWWCSATGKPWSWDWQPFPGVWLFVLAVAWAARTLLRNGRWERTPRLERAALVTGVLALWAALDWPLGPLAAGYLSLAHALQFLMTAFVAAPLLVVGLRVAVTDKAVTAPWQGIHASIGRLLTNPLVAAVLFNIIVAGTHVPRVVDGYMTSPLGAFVIDVLWLVGGILFWWPIVISVPDHGRFKHPMKLGYLLLGTLFHTILAMVLATAEFPLYGIYELAPPFPSIDALTDQKLAGGAMELGGLGLIFIAATIIFFQWVHTDAPKARP